MAGIEICVVRKFLDPHWEKLDIRFNYRAYTRLHGFKYTFSKKFWGEAHRAPSFRASQLIHPHNMLIPHQ